MNFFDDSKTTQSVELHFDAVDRKVLELLGILPDGYTHSEEQSRRPDMHVIFDKNATTVFFDKDTKVTVKAHGEAIDHEKGFAMAIAKYIFSDENGHWKNRFMKYINAAEQDETKKIVNKAMKDLKPFYMKHFEKAYIQQAKKYTQIESITDYISAKKALLDSGVSLDDIESYSNAAHHKALTATLRQRKNYIPAETGLTSEQINSALTDAIARYSEHVMDQGW